MWEIFLGSLEIFVNYRIKTRHGEHNHFQNEKKNSASHSKNKGELKTKINESNENILGS